MSYLLHTVLITLVVLVADVAVEIYIPALPSIGAFFSASAETIKLTLGVNILGIALSSLVYGALSDAWGRKPSLLLGLSIFLLASICCIFATSVSTLIFWRFLQGVGQGVAVVVGFASIKDFYSGERCAQVISRLSTVVAVSPAFAPLLGSMILLYFTWHYIFLFLASVAVICLLMLIFFFKETLKHKSQLSLGAILRSYRRIVRNKNYVLYVSVVVITFMWLWNIISSAPFLLLNDMNVPMNQYGYLVAINVSGFVIGTILNHRYLHAVGLRKFIRFGLTLPLLSEMILIILHYTIGFSALLLECIWFFSAMGLAFVIGNATTLALDQVDECDNGKANALLVFLEMVFGAFGVYINAPFYNGTIVPLASFTIGCVLVTMVILLILSITERKEGIITEKMSSN